MPPELEAKLIAPDELRLPDLNGLVKGATAVRLPHRRLEAIYFGTPELRLARSGITLRYHTGEDGPPWTVKLLEGSSGATLRRREVSFEGHPDRFHLRSPTWSGPTRGPVRSSLSPVCTPTARPSRSAVPTGALAEITDDRGAAYDEHGQQTGGFREVEVEIRAKPCRYAAEAAAPVCGHQADRFAAAIAMVQAIVGASPRHRRR